MAKIKITGTGSYLPPKVLDNAYFADRLETTDDWIKQRVGIEERHVVTNESLLDLMLPAAQQAMAAANITSDQIDLIIVATVSSDKVFPSAACQLQAALGVSNESPAFDLSAACAGFIYAFNVALKFLEDDSAKTVLLIGVDAFSKLVDWNDRNTCILFGDGAGAMVLQQSAHSQVLATKLHADGTHGDKLYVNNAIWHESAPQYVNMQGKEVFRYATLKLGELVTQLVHAAGIKQSDIDWLIPHQANKRIIEAIAKKLDLSEDKIIQTIGQQGNTSAASVPLAFDHAIRSGKIAPGDILMLEAFGGGFAWGAVLLKY